MGKSLTMVSNIYLTSNEVTVVFLWIVCSLATVFIDNR